MFLKIYLDMFFVILLFNLQLFHAYASLLILIDFKFSIEGQNSQKTKL